MFLKNLFWPTHPPELEPVLAVETRDYVAKPLQEEITRFITFGAYDLRLEWVHFLKESQNVSAFEKNLQDLAPRYYLFVDLVPSEKYAKNLHRFKISFESLPSLEEIPTHTDMSALTQKTKPPTQPVRRRFVLVILKEIIHLDRLLETVSELRRSYPDLLLLIPYETPTQKNQLVKKCHDFDLNIAFEDSLNMPHVYADVFLLNRFPYEETLYAISDLCVLLGGDSDDALRIIEMGAPLLLFGTDISSHTQIKTLINRGIIWHGHTPKDNLAAAIREGMLPEKSANTITQSLAWLHNSQNPLHKTLDKLLASKN